MKRTLPWILLVVLSFSSTACQEQAPESSLDLAALQNDIQKKTEKLYWVHLKLDTALTELEKAEAALEEGNASAAEYHSSEAHRVILLADEAVLDLGQELQQTLNLDIDRNR